MKRAWIVIIVILALLALWGVTAYNGFVNQEEAVKQSWAQVENQYQRRADLIPNLVNTVRGYAAHESSTLEGVISARARATQVTVNPDDLSPEAIAEYQAAQGQLSTALGRLLAVAESYPDLKANQNFLELQAQLEGTENRIAVERQRFNETVQTYNTSLRRFPGNIFAGMFGFSARGYFEAAAGSEVAPTVQF
jgi:LemA protein